MTWAERWDRLGRSVPGKVGVVPVAVADEMRMALLLEMCSLHGPGIAEVVRRYLDGELVERVPDEEPA